MASTPTFKDSEMYQLLRMGHIEEFNQRREAGETCDLDGADLRGLDLQNLNASNLNMHNAYLRQTDIRGIDFSSTNMHGASINSAKISGTLFPVELSASEINLSLMHGTRMRYRS